MGRKALSTKGGYYNHPQLDRFKEKDSPVAALDAYLHHIVDEADSRGYDFDRSKLGDRKKGLKVSVPKGQLTYEINHLLDKLKSRDPEKYSEVKDVKSPQAHPSVSVTKGGVADWERVK